MTANPLLALVEKWPADRHPDAHSDPWTLGYLRAKRECDDDEPASDWGTVCPASRQAIWDAMSAAAPDAQSTPQAGGAEALADALYRIANNHDAHRNGLPDEFHDWAAEVGRDLRSAVATARRLASAPRQCKAHQCKRIRVEMQAEIDRLRSAPAVVVDEAWVPVAEQLPEEGELVVVYIPDTGDGDGFHFDLVEDGLWFHHEQDREHFLMVGGANAAGPDAVCIGPAETAPYTHWRRIGKPAALAAALGQGAGK